VNTAVRAWEHHAGTHRRRGSSFPLCGSDRWRSPGGIDGVKLPPGRPAPKARPITPGPWERREGLRDRLHHIEAPSHSRPPDNRESPNRKLGRSGHCHSALCLDLCAATKVGVGETRSALPTSARPFPPLSSRLQSVQSCQWPIKCPAVAVCGCVSGAASSSLRRQSTDRSAACSRWERSPAGARVAGERGRFEAHHPRRLHFCLCQASSFARARRCWSFRRQLGVGEVEKLTAQDPIHLARHQSSR